MDRKMEHNEKQSDKEYQRNDSQLSFGAYLKKVRTEKGIDIEEVMDFTRISKFVLEQIEAENRSKLPEDVYLKGFLKSFAQAVGADPTDVLERYSRVIRRDEEKKEKDREKKHAPTSSFPFMKIFSALLVIGIIIGSVFAVQTYMSLKKQKAVSDVAAPAEQVPNASGAVTNAEAGKVEIPATKGPQKDVQAGAGLKLDVICVEPTVIKISIDGKAPEEHAMKPQEHLELTAENFYNILIGNSCGVQLFLNNNQVRVPGKCGQTVNVRLP
jgi:cytoskeletal protein RodZ